MMTIITCEECGSSHIGVHLEVTVKIEKCKSCGNFTVKKWSFYLCSVECTQRWMSKYPPSSVPCRDCRNMQGESTGYFAGFKENGTCPTCNGEKVVKSVQQ